MGTVIWQRPLTTSTHRHPSAAVGRILDGGCRGGWTDYETPAHGPYGGYGVAADLPNWHRSPLSALTAKSLPKKEGLITAITV